NWSVSGPGTISNGVYVAPASIASTEFVTVKATSHADSSRSATATVAIRPIISVAINPATVALGAGQQQTFSASVTGSTNGTVTWSASGPGSISNGTYTAPNLISAAQGVTVTATSVADNTKTATAKINLVPISISVTPPRATLSAGQQQKFSAYVAGS